MKHVTIVRTTVLAIHDRDAADIREAGVDGLVYDEELGLQYYSEAAGAVINWYITTPVSSQTTITVEDEAKDIK